MAISSLPTHLNAQQYTQLSVWQDPQYKLEWGRMQPQPRPCFTPTLLQELMTWYTSIRQRNEASASPEVLYYIMASGHEGIYNLGGDLNLFYQLIQQRDREALLKYAIACIEPLYENIVHAHSPQVKSISLVQGDALGGGFECALSCNVLVAEKGCKMGFPEILFNLFPGMGAYTLLSRRIGQSRAEEMILTGRIHMSEELHAMGVVDVLAEPGEGHLAVYDYIQNERRSRNGMLAFRRAREAVNPVSFEELRTITEIWVDAAVSLSAKDLRMMERLVNSQNKRITHPETQPTPAAKYG